MTGKAYDLYEKGAKVLKNASIPDWDYDSRILLESICGITRMDLLLEPERIVEEEDVKRYFEYIEKRAAHEPLQYLIGEWEFMGLPFKVNPSVLIPRQDTECLMEWMLQRESKPEEANQQKQLKLLDVCTGSGCIAISMDILWKEYSPVPLQVEALDLSKDALNTAESNRLLNQSKVRFFESDMFEKVENTYDIIVSNPPYIPSKVVDGLMAEVVQFEPRMALDGMEDGLYFYRILAKDGKKYLNPGGRLYLEIGHDQGKTVPDILKNEGYKDIEVRKDLSGNDRCVRAVFAG